MPAVVSGRLAYAIKLAQHGVRLRMDEVLRPIGLTTPQYGVLCALEAEPGMSNAKLARSLFVTAQTMHGTLSNLEREGLVSRSPDQGHGKRLSGLLTPKGAALLNEAHELVSQVERRLADGLDANEARSLTDALLECARRLG